MESRYWDTAAFLCLLQNAEGSDVCASVLRAAETGQLRIVTSALTLVEVVKLRHNKAIPKADAEKIRLFFQHRYIEVKDLNRYIADAARGLVWNNGVDPKDAIHVATALRFHVPRLDTFDGNLCKRDGQIGNPPLRIMYPSLDQGMLDLGDRESGSEETETSGT